MRHAHPAAVRRCWAEDRRRKAEARECGDADRPDARAMFLAEDDLINARAHEAKVRRVAREAFHHTRQKELQQQHREAAERHLELLRKQQVKALVRGELTPEKIVKFRETHNAMMPAELPRKRRKRLSDLTSPSGGGPF